MNDPCDDRWRAWLPAALLVVVASTQIVLARAAELSPWKGGGFGMFATSDGTSTRFVRLYVRGPGRSEEIAMQPSFERAAARAQLFPSTPLMRRLAAAVASREQRYQRPVTEVTVQVWRTVFTPGPLRANDSLIRELTFDVAEGAVRQPIR
jgi:hypothetical protein